jgi:hypothetical protein
MATEAVNRESVKSALAEMNSAQAVFSLFKTLGFPKEALFDTTAKRRKEAFEFKKEDVDRVKEIYAVTGFYEQSTGRKDKNQVFLIEASTLVPSFVRSITASFDRLYPEFLLILTTDYSKAVFALPRHEEVKGKSKLKITRLSVERPELRYTDVQTIAGLAYAEGESAREQWRRWQKAFSVEKVTDDFFEDYKNTFFQIRKAMLRQKVGVRESHEFTLNFLNRIMFVYFISKKGWLKHKNFLRWFWDKYKKTTKLGSDEFYDKWLKQIFFRAFNSRGDEIKSLPKDVINSVLLFPYLNGGLFTENEYDKLGIRISDSLFKSVFEFFEKYNFTIKEDLPVDEEVAVDPQMIGYVYESLANIADESYEEDLRGDWGIFYTPRVEVDFMCRRSLVEYLSGSLSGVPKEKVYHLLFDLPEESEKFDKSVDARFWKSLEESLDNLSAVDPACGSGAFLVGMLNVLADLYKRTYLKLGKQKRDYDLKKTIAMKSLYGVDVMPWAIHAAELRLWLQLIVETEMGQEELRKGPLLPNLTMNLRIGDSLVQEIGGINLTFRSSNIPEGFKRRLEELKIEKQKYFNNDDTRRLMTVAEIEKEQNGLFLRILNDRITKLKLKISDIQRLGSKQVGLNGKVLEAPQRKIDSEAEKHREMIMSMSAEITMLESVRDELTKGKKRPFVWDIDFGEIFGDKGGFDIVIGNPPYVRQEMISPPEKLKSEVDLEDRKEYKERLINSVKARFPMVEKLDRKSDLYVYFYFHGLSLLNPKGTFCFITSNSWLDVGYGAELQEFLCKYVPIIAVYDNPKRSFAHADVNTIIALFGAPAEEGSVEGLRMAGGAWPMLGNTANLVMFRKPFEEVLSAKNLIEIDGLKAAKTGKLTEIIDNIAKTNDYRAFPILQGDLLEDGWEYPEDYEASKGRFKSGDYGGNKWGGKFLRAPDIFYTILEKGKGKLVRIGDIADVRFGIKTGVNEFFYLDEEAQNKWQIEKEFLRPVIRSPKEVESIIVDPSKLNYKIFKCNKSKTELKETNALKFIEWGEKQITEDGVLWPDVPSVSGRRLWYDVGEREYTHNFWPYIMRERLFSPYSDKEVYVDNNLFEIHTNIDSKLLCVTLNSTILKFFNEMFSRSYGGGGGPLKNQVYEVAELPVILPKKASIRLINVQVRDIFTEIGIDPSKPIRDQEPKPLPDRAELDEIIFDELGLTEQERKEVYWSVCELVKQRLDKARSMGK